MGRAKDLIVKPISAADANKIVRALHYSGKVVNNSQIHLGVFLDGRCGGAMQFGPSLDKRKLQGLRGGRVSRTTMTKGGNILESGASSMKAFKEAGWRPKAGFQLRYIYFLDPTARERLTVPILPFSEIDRRGAGMYRGKPRVRSADSGTSGNQPESGGANPTRTLSVDQEIHQAE